MLILVFIAASMMYSLESKAQPEAFGSVFKAIWWAVVTMTTVGYGDITPITVPGRLIGVVIMILGVGTVALPAGMLAARFSEELQARKDQLTASVVDALRDGEVGARDRDQLERLREELDLPDEVLQRIVHLQQSEVTREGRCPHCGKPIRIPETS
jgi:voltage-gated potassium channel